MHTVGIDPVEVEAFQTAIDRMKDLYDRIVALEEQKDHKRAGVENSSSWFAGKEAVKKALITNSDRK
jgi:phosphopantetheinyl transferase (holo-ACP synthase)